MSFKDKDKSDRKILHAKRHTGSSVRPNVLFHANNEDWVPSQGIKRSSKHELDDYPPRKKQNTNFDRPQPSTSFSSPMTKSFANDRLSKLRRSLEELKKKGQSRISQGEVLHTNVATSTPQIARVLPSYMPTSIASPIQNRIRNVKSTLTEQVTTQLSPCIAANVASPIQNRLQICNNNSTLTELMDWGPIDEETVLTNINEIRKEISYENQMPMDDLLIPSQEAEIPAATNGIFIVVDTNIFLSKLDFLAKLRNSEFSGFGQISIIVPWMVIQELDYMKDNSGNNNLGKNARKAIQYINKQLLQKDMFFKGQSALDASNQTVCSNNPDDGILYCCMQLVEEEKFVILLSNDTNLRNKALVHNVHASHSDTLLDDLKQQKSITLPEFNHSSIQKVKILLSVTLTKIIEKEMTEAYGAVWLKMVQTRPPYTPEEALHLMQKYWKAVFSFALQKQALQRIETFISFLKLHPKDERYTTADFNKLIENSLSLCIYLKNGYSHHRSSVCECIKGIQICAE